MTKEISNARILIKHQIEANAKFASLLQDISKKAEREDIEQAIAELIGSAPEALDTLYELAEALGNDPEFATTVMTMINGKVDKIDGKGLSTEDYTTEEKQKLAGIEAGANKYVHPSTHPASMITESPQRRFVSDEEKARWDAKWDYNEETIRNVKVYHAVNADTVNGKTVESNVPANAKFTDTTYSEITEAEIDAGTSSTLRTISGRRVKYILDKVKGWINSLTKADIGLENVDNVKQASKAEFDSHQNNTSIHITEIERQNWNAKAEVDQIPTKVSQLENDKNYVTVDELGHAGYGDMHKSIYDKNNDGVVDKADEASFQIVLDAREEDRSPIFYLTNGQKIMWELKYRTAVGNPPAEASANSTYAFVATVSGWNDGSGGYPVQVSFGKKIAVRQGVSNESWSNWQVMASAEDIPSKLSQLEKDINFDERYYTENEVDTMLAGKADIVHAHTKSQVGLTNVEDYGVASQAEAEAGTASNKYMTPERTSQAINALQAVKSVNNKTGAVTITKSDIGLGNVENYGVATQSEAEVGASNSKYMTPIRTKQAIESLSPVKSVNGKTGDVTVTKADIGLGNVLNERQATKTELDALKNSLESADSNLEASINRLQSKIDSNVYPPNNTARSNLGNPSLFEAAIIESQATNKLWFYPADKILIEQSDDGVVFTERTDISLAQKKKLVSGNNNADISFPKGKYLRITISAKGYVYLNWLYLYISTLGDRASFKIEKKRDDEENWVTVCDYTNSVNGWPAHVFIPHANIPFSPNSTSGHYNHVRITIKAAEQTNSYDYMKLHGLEWWGGYPQGRRTIYSHDENQNVTFPANVIASTFKNASGKEVLYQGDIPTKLSSFTKDINFDERYYTKSEVDQKLSGKSDVGHTHTKSEVGLSNVQNYGIATQSEAEAGTATNKYMTPERTKQAILALQSVKSVNSRTGDVVITKSDVGLGSVQNYGLATQAQAEAGSVDTAYMTPLKTKYAINALSPVKSVAGKTGAVTLSSSDVGLGNVQNYGVATQSEAEAGTASNKYMTPLTTKQAINALSPVKSVNGKTGAVSITKSDVSLGNVQNYGIATQAEAEAGVSDAKYMTPLKTKQAIVKTISEYKYGGRYQWVYNENTDSLELIYIFDSLELI